MHMHNLETTNAHEFIGHEYSAFPHQFVRIAIINICPFSSLSKQTYRTEVYIIQDYAHSRRPFQKTTKKKTVELIRTKRQSAISHYQSIYTIHKLITIQKLYIVE